jgi:hypothetical protein
MKHCRATFDVRKGSVAAAAAALQYMAGVIVKLPISFPESVSTVFGKLGAAWSNVFGSHASLDCLLTPPDTPRKSG